MIVTRDLVSFYQLVDPRNDLPFYVGQTTNLERRRKQYTRNATLHSNPLGDRIYELRRAGLEPIMQEIESRECTPGEAQQREGYWIQQRVSEAYAWSTS